MDFWVILLYTASVSLCFCDLLTQDQLVSVHVSLPPGMEEATQQTVQQALQLYSQHLTVMMKGTSREKGNSAQSAS